jgi:DNA invertase Pin-like site-specific DNA recombinase
MTVPPLSPHEIATFLLDSGMIDRGTADRLEQRIAAYADERASEGRKEGIAAAARKAAAVAGSLKGAGQRAAAEKVWRAIEMLLPHGREAEQAYARGFKDGTEHRSGRQRQIPGAN